MHELNWDLPVTLMSPLFLALAVLLGQTAREVQTGDQESVDQALFSFALVADIQFADKPDAGRRRYGSSVARLEQAVLDWRDEDLAFLVQLGDLIDGRDNDDLEGQDLELVLTTLAKSELPLRHVIGNHGLELPRAILQDRLGLGNTWYSFVRDGWRFLVVDSLWLGSKGRGAKDPLAEDAELFLKRFGESAKRVDRLPQARPWNGALGPVQRAWLADELAAADAAGQHAVIFSHLPVHPAGAHPATVLWDFEDVLAILEGSPAFTAWIAGHHHAGGYANIAGRHFLTMRGMVEAEPGKNSYGVVHVHGDRLVIDGRGNAIDRVLDVPKAPLAPQALLAAPTLDQFPARSHYQGRRIAQTMHWKGAEWLLREAREEEENSAVLLDALGIQPGWSVADFGCGNGYFSLPLAERVGATGRLYGLDIQDEMLKMLRYRAEQAGIENIEPVLSSELATGLTPVSCDLILMVDVYHELNRPELVLGEARRALKAGGLLALVEFREEDPEVPIKPEHKMSRAAVIRELEANGFALAREFTQLPMQHVLLFRARW